MNRRECGQRLAGAAVLLPGLGLGLGLGRAVAEPVEQRDYVLVKPPMAVKLAPGQRIEVLEFFWYECPHCNGLEPMLQAWRGRLAPDVQLRCVPVGYTPRHRPGQRLFATLEAMGVVERVHARIYTELHEGFRRIDSAWQRVALVRALGLDADRFSALFDTPEVDARVREADRLVKAYGVDGVPMLAVQGRFLTSPEMTGGRAPLLAVLDRLVERSRAPR